MGLAVLWLATARAEAASPTIIIAEIYGGGGLVGATYRNDFIVLFNRGNTPVNVNGWSVQYGAAGGSTWQVTTLPNVFIQPGGYFLIQAASGGVSGALLPPPVDAISAINLGSTAGKVALVNNNTPLAGACPVSPSLVDLVGYGATANCFEGSGRAPTPGTTTSVQRLNGGCADTDNNAADFVAAAPNPRNSASPPQPCVTPTPPSGVGAANPAAVDPGQITVLTVAVTPGDNPPSTGLFVHADLTAIGGPPSQPFFDDGTNGDEIPNDNVFTFVTFVFSPELGTFSLPFTVNDFEGRFGNGSITLYVPIQTQIAALRNQQDAVNWLPTDTVNLYRVEGTVISHVNLTTPANALFYLQDATAGIAVFVSGGSAIRPAAGDYVRVTGPVGHFNGLLELNLTAGNPAHSVVTLANGNPLPTPTLLNFSDSNSVPYMEYQLEGRRAKVSGVFLDLTTPNFPTGGGDVLMTNGQGEVFVLRVDARVTDIAGTPKPSGPVTIIGVVAQFDTADPRTSGYQLLPTRLADIMTETVPILTLVHLGGNPIGSLTDNGGGSFTVIGAGNDAWDNMDECTFAYHEVTGDFDVKVRVEFLEPNSPWSKAGLMIRETLAEDSRMAFNRVTPPPVVTSTGGEGANDLRFAYRTGVHEPTGNFGDDHNGGRHEDIDPGNPYPSPPYPNAWLRLVREGSTITAYNSSDGFNWFYLGSQETGTWRGGPLPPTVLLGLAVSRHPGDQSAPSGPTALAEFRNYHFQAGGQMPFGVAGASSRGNPNGVRVEFNHPVGPSAYDPSHYTVSGAGVLSASAGPNASTVQLTTTALTEGQNYTVDIGPGVTDANGLPIQGAASAEFFHGGGYELRRIRIARNMIPGPEVTPFLSSVAYQRDIPTACQGLNAVSSFSFFQDNTPNTQSNENYSARVSGVLRVTVPGLYRFACASDDKGILSLSTDDDPATKQPIAFEPEWSNPRAFASPDRRPNQENQSAPINLPPGDYYLEYTFAEGGGGNHAAVTWDNGSGAAFVDGQLPLRSTQFAPFRMFAGSVFFTLGPVFVRSQPQDQTVPEGASATFSVKLDGTPPYSLQWHHNGVPIPGATGTRYTTPPLTVADSGASYHVQIGNEFSSTISSTAVVTVVLSPPVIESQPVDITVTDCGDAQFTVAASGAEPLSYRWRRNDVDLPGEINSTLVILGAGLADIGAYTVVVNNDSGSVTSEVAQLFVVNLPPTVFSPADINYYADAGACSASGVNLGMAFADDECGALPVSNDAPVSFPVGTTHVTWTATDRNGVSSSSVQAVTIFDLEPPFLTVPPNQLAECAGAAGTPVFFTATVVDNCAGATIQYSYPPGFPFPLGDTIVTVNATDASGNPANGSFIVTVRDTTPPQPAVCLDPPVAIQHGGPGVNVFQPASPSPQLTQAMAQPTAGFNDPNTFVPFAHTVDELPECLTDAEVQLGLIAADDFFPDSTVTLVDPAAGVLRPLWTGYLGQPGPNGEPPITRGPWFPGAQEIVTLNLARLPLADGATLDLVPTVAPRRALDLVVSAGTQVDFVGLNVLSCRASEPIIVDTDPGQPGAVVEFPLPAFTDNCSATLNVVPSVPSGSFFPIGRTFVVFTAADGSGNTGRTWIDVICRDNEPPTLECEDVLLECAKPGGAPVFYHVEARDNSGQAEAQCFPPSGSMFPIGATPVQCFAFDPSGNQAVCTFTVTLTRRLPPAIQTVEARQNEFMIEFLTEAGLEYVVEFKNNLTDLYWSELTTVIGIGGPMTVTDPMTQPNRFYRVAVRSPSSEHDASIYEPPEPPPAQPGGSEPCRPTCGPPWVYLFSGEFHYAVTDLCLKGRGLDFVWARKYRSCVCFYTAMGYAWDYSYNICIVPDGPNLLLFDGNTREDVLFRQPDGSFAADQFFREGRFDSNGVFVLTFADRGVWEFQPLDGSPAAGRITRIADRNGNALRFFYNGFGQLALVKDTLDRDITISYDADGFISAVTDFAGRAVRYTHYQDGDADGGFGDLRSVTSPAVVDAVNGNNFPDGKTHRYTYSKGFADEQLNHNLLTITDGKGQMWLSNTYVAPGPFYCDQVVRQVWGYANEVLTYDYSRVSPGPANNYAVVKALVNDRVGNVSEYFFDAGNRCVLHRAFTGRATPGVTTTDTANRPRGKLRASDPDYFETRWEWNVDSLPTRIAYPNGNVTENVYELELNPNAPRRARGNLRVCRKLPGVPGGDQPALVEQFEYEAGLGGGCCDFNFVTRRTDARGHVTLHFYDVRGNRLHTQHRLPASSEDWEYNEFGQETAHVWPDNGTGHRRRDVSVYYGTGHQRGYLAQRIVDAGGLALTTTYEYDRVGNVVRAVDPRGHDTLYDVNALNQVLRETSREVKDGSGIRYRRDFFYDANNNLVRADVENRDDAGALAANTHYSTVFDFDILNVLTRVARERGDARLPATALSYEAIRFADRPQFVVTEYAYDANRNRTLERRGEAVAGRDPFNVVQSSYDERDLLFREIRAPGSALQQTTQHDYDGNRNRARRSQGLEDAPRVTVNAHDGFNRLTRVTDPMGNVTRYNYDANGNLTRERFDGEMSDLPGGAGNRRLAETFHTYDAMDRRTQSDRAHFDPQHQQPIGDGLATTRTFYSDNSQPVRLEDDRGNATVIAYDRANRTNSVTDAKGNQTTYSYDANGNVVRVTELERSDLGNPAQTFVTTYDYDNLDRLVRTIPPGGGGKHMVYDSLNNRVQTTDAGGRATRFAYDGLGRLTQTSRDMNTNGAFRDAADIVTTQVWDDSCRLIAQTDDNGRVTRHACDALDRRFATRMADGTLHLVGIGSITWPDGAERPVVTEAFVNGHDAHDNVVFTTDANGTVTTTTYDSLDRPASRFIDRAAGVAGATYEIFQYNGRSQVVVAENDFTRVGRGYNSLCNLIRETLNFDAPSFGRAGDKLTTWSHDGAGNVTTCVYPGGRVVTRRYDELNRLAEVCNGVCLDPAPAPPAPGSLVAEIFYFGPRRVEMRCFGNGACGQIAADAARRPLTIVHSKAGTVFDQRAFAWDADGNKTSRADTRPGGPQLTHAYAYDAADRLVRTVVMDPAGAVRRDSLYSLDGAGNRSHVSSDPPPGNYSLDATQPDPADAQVNQYSATPHETGRQYDANGNLTALAGGARPGTLAYDYRNRLVAAQPSAGAPLNYTCDALGRRVQRTVGAEVTRFFHDGHREIEEQDASGATRATFVYDASGAEALSMRRGGADFYFHTDDLGSVLAASDAAGHAVERYDYGDFGQPEIAVHVQTPDGASGFISDFDPSPYGVQEVADDFSFSRSVRIRGLRWWGSYGFGAPTPTDDFTIRIHADSSGVPGAVLHSTAAGNNVSRAPTGRILGVGSAEYVYEAKLAAPFDAQPGVTYWLSVVANTAGEPASWGIGSAGNGNLYAAGTTNTGARWDTAPVDTAFELFADESAIANPHLFTGRRYDAETGFYHERGRPLDPLAGRFVSRDPAGVWAEPAHWGNPLTFAANNPSSGRPGWGGDAGPAWRADVSPVCASWPSPEFCGELAGLWGPAWFCFRRPCAPVCAVRSCERPALRPAPVACPNSFAPLARGASHESLRLPSPGAGSCGTTACAPPSDAGATAPAIGSAVPPLEPHGGRK